MKPITTLTPFSPLLFTLALAATACTPVDAETGSAGTHGDDDGATGAADDTRGVVDESGGGTDTGDTADTGETGDDTGGIPQDNPCETLCGSMDGTPAAGLSLVKSAGQTATAHCGTYHLGISQDDSVAVFSILQDNLAFVNEGDAPITITDLRLIPGGADGKDLEWSLRSDADLTHAPLSQDEVVGQTITGESPLTFDVRLQPAASGPREACLALSTDSGDDYLVTVTGRGSESPRLDFSTAFDIEEDVRFGAMTNIAGDVVAAMSNEAHEPGAVDSTNAMYSIGRNVGPGGFAEVTAIAKRKADGSWGWFKLLEGRDGTTQVDAKILAVSDETNDFGTSHVTAVDDEDNLFVILNVGVASNSDFHRAVVVKLDPDGNVLWSRGWVADPAYPAQANDIANFQAMALADGKVILTGYTGGSNTVGNGIPIVALDAATGDLVFSTVFQLDAGGSQEGLSLAVDGDALYVGGAGARAFVAKFSGLDDDSLAMDWTQRIDVGFTGTRVRSLTMAEGNVCGLVRGTSTQNMFHMFCLDPQGDALWNRQLGNAPSSRTRSQVITYADGSLYAGGAIQVAELSIFGEGALLKVSPSGELDWSAFYYTGKGAEEVGFHSVKGITVRDGSLMVQGQAWTGPSNIDWYQGFWYDGEAAGLTWTEFADNAAYAYAYGMGSLADNAGDTLVQDTSDFLVFTDVSPEDPADVEEGAPAYLFQDASERHRGPGGDYDGLLQVLSVK